MMSEPEAPSPAYSAVAPAVRQLVQKLRALLRASGRPPAEIARAVGLSEAAWSRQLSEPSRLEVRQLFAALEAADLHPAQLFPRLRKERSRMLPHMAVLAEAAGGRLPALDLRDERSGESEERRLTELLSSKLRAGQRKLRPTSLELGLSADRLGQLLRSGGPLRVWHLFALLDLLDVPVEAFVDELYGLVDGLPDGALPGGHRWGELKALVERLEGDLACLEADPGWDDPEGKGEVPRGLEAWEDPRSGWDSAALGDREAEPLAGSWEGDGEKG